jgi:periplasmic divalent cation tolerance protein
VSGEAALIWCPFPDEEQARAAVAALLDERLIACANMVPGMRSLFAWEGERSSSQECGALLKTTQARLAAAMERLEMLHPYDTPAITAWPVTTTAATGDWLNQETGKV